MSLPGLVLVAVLAGPSGPAPATPAEPLPVSPLGPPEAKSPPDIPSYAEAMDRTLRDQRLTRVNVELVTRTWSEDGPGGRDALVARYGADRLVVVATRTSHGAAPLPQLRPAEPSIVAKDRSGKYVLLRAKPVEHVTYQHAHDCSGVQGVRAIMTVEETVAVLPQGAKISRTVDVPFLRFVVVTTHAPECNSIP
jgi:hypothetical protein